MRRISIFIRLSDWSLDQYKEQLQQLSNDAFGIESIYVTNEGSEIFDPIKAETLINLFQYAPTTEITLEIQPELAQNIPKQFNRVSLMDCQNYSSEELLPALSLCDNINIDWDFSDTFNMGAIKTFVGLNAPHKAVYGVEDSDEFAQISQELQKADYTPYDDFHFCKSGFQSKYLQVTNSKSGQWIGIGPNAQSHIG